MQAFFCEVTDNVTIKSRRAEPRKRPVETGGKGTGNRPLTGRDSPKNEQFMPLAAWRSRDVTERTTERRMRRMSGDELCQAGD
jgi:hypothetical protein